MRWILALPLMLGLAAEGHAQDYCESYSEGYSAGWCDDYPAGACPPAPPSGCISGGEADSEEAYIRGYLKGAEDEGYEVAPESEDE